MQLRAFSTRNILFLLACFTLCPALAVEVQPFAEYCAEQKEVPLQGFRKGTTFEKLWFLKSEQMKYPGASVYNRIENDLADAITSKCAAVNSALDLQAFVDSQFARCNQRCGSWTDEVKTQKNSGITVGQLNVIRKECAQLCQQDSEKQHDRAEAFGKGYDLAFKKCNPDGIIKAMSRGTR